MQIPLIQVLPQRVAGFNPDLAQEEIQKQLLKSKIPITHYEVANKDCLIGIEVEVEYIFKRTGYLMLPEAHAFLWNSTEDNSLRNNGREFVSQPIKGNQIPFALEVLFTGLKKDRSTIGYEFSDRTSIHVHVNYRNDTLETLANTLLIYLTVEKLLYEFVGGNRSKNIFCVPLYDSNSVEGYALLFKALQGDANAICDVLKTYFSKYSGLNLLPLLKYGTIEYRHLVGTDDRQKIMSWINLILKIKTYASKMDFQSLKPKILDLNSSSEYLLLLKDIFGTAFFYSDILDIEQKIEESTMYIKEIFSYSDKDIKCFTEIICKDSEKTLISEKFKDKLRTSKVIQLIPLQNKSKLEIHIDDFMRGATVWNGATATTNFTTATTTDTTMNTTTDTTMRVGAGVPRNPRLNTTLVLDDDF